MLMLYNHGHHPGRGDIEVGPDAECRVIDPEAFAEIIDADKGVPAAHGYLLVGAPKHQYSDRSEGN
jgi:hypothetical protein